MVVYVGPSGNRAGVPCTVPEEDESKDVKTFGLEAYRPGFRPGDCSLWRSRIFGSNFLGPV